MMVVMLDYMEMRVWQTCLLALLAAMIVSLDPIEHHQATPLCLDLDILGVDRHLGMHFRVSIVMETMAETEQIMPTTAMETLESCLKLASFGPNCLAKDEKLL